VPCAGPSKETTDKVYFLDKSSFVKVGSMRALIAPQTAGLTFAVQASGTFARGGRRPGPAFQL